MALTDDDRIDFATALSGLFESFQREMTDGVMHGYWLGLGDLTLREVQLAIVAAIRSCERLPTPHELRKLVGQSVSTQDNAIHAWSIALNAVAIGPYKHVDFADKTINATIRGFGGWPQFVASFDSAEAEKWVRIEFIKNYAALRASGVNGEIAKPLAGLSEKQVIGGMLCDPVPVRIECKTAIRIAGKPTVAGLLS